MPVFEVALKLYKLINEGEREVEEELRELGKIIKTRSQLNDGVEYVSITKVSRGDVKGLIVIRGERERVIGEAQLITTLIKSSFKSIDVENASSRGLIEGLKNFF